MIVNDKFLSMLNSPVRYLRGRVEVYEGSTLSLLCGCHDRLKEFTIERMGENKFFGYGICNRINVSLIDFDRSVNLTTNHSLEVEFGVDTNYIYPFPRFYITDVYRDENNNEVSITGYDALYKAAEHTVDELSIGIPYTIKEFAEACGAFLGVPVDTGELEAFNTVYESGANFEGTETIRAALNAIAEATQTIYYINSEWTLVFKRLDIEGNALLTIDREKYITLDSGANRRLTSIVSATELGDNLSVSLAASGTTQYVRDNPFWDLHPDRAALLDNALAAVGGLTINQFSCDWRGNFLLEIGDKIELITKDNKQVYSYLLNDSLTFNGSLSQFSEWAYDDNETESESNPNNLGDALKKTFARVDKVNKQIDLVVSDVEYATQEIANLRLTADAISASVSSIKDTTDTTLADLTQDVVALTQEVEAKLSAEDFSIAVKKELDNGVNKVITSTGFVFDDTGLTVSRSGTEMTTTISEDGMKVYRDGEEMLTANNAGVNAVNLHATTYLIIGTTSRLENYKLDRTACFWIGG